MRNDTYMNLDSEELYTDFPYRRAVFMVEVLYDPYLANVPEMSLSDVAWQISEGGSSGRVSLVVDEGLSRNQAAALLELHGSDPAFLPGDDFEEEAPADG